VRVGAVDRSIPSAGGRKYYLDDTLFGHYQQFVHEALQYYLGQVLATEQWRIGTRMTDEQRKTLLTQVVAASKLAAQRRTLQEALASKGIRAVYGSSLN